MNPFGNLKFLKSAKRTSRMIGATQMAMERLRSFLNSSGRDITKTTTKIGDKLIVINKPKVIILTTISTTELYNLTLDSS